MSIYSIQINCAIQECAQVLTRSSCPPGGACGLKELHEVKHGDLSNMLEGGGSMVGCHTFMKFLIVYVGRS